jgi:secondary thiamine-phosphate synthase enzyme
MTLHASFTITTAQREHFVDITARVRQAMREHGLEEGVAHVYCPHTTAGIVIQENADADLRLDLAQALATLAPVKPWRHREGNADAHIKAMLVGTSATVPVSRGRLMLGQWQGIYLAEFDGPRQRNVIVSTLRASA